MMGVRRLMVLIGASMAVAACSDPTSSGEACGRADLRLTTPSGSRDLRMDAAFYVGPYGDGPMPIPIASIAFGTRALEQPPVQLDVIDAMLQPGSLLPAPGTFPATYFTSTSTSTVGGFLLATDAGEVQSHHAVGESSTVTIDSVTADCVAGRMSIAFGALPTWSPTHFVTGTFRAARVSAEDSLPRPIRRVP
jgi:hypothetical protein